MTTNLQNVFDAITGFGGSASSDGWREMSREELIQNADGQSDFYSAITSTEAEKIADTVIAYRECDNQHDGIVVRNSLND